jgi:hypothetical protein
MLDFAIGFLARGAVMLPTILLMTVGVWLAMKKLGYLRLDHPFNASDMRTWPLSYAAIEATVFSLVFAALAAAFGDSEFFNCNRRGHGGTRRDWRRSSAHILPSKIEFPAGRSELLPDVERPHEKGGGRPTDNAVEEHAGTSQVAPGVLFNAHFNCGTLKRRRWRCLGYRIADAPRISRERMTHDPPCAIPQLELRRIAPSEQHASSLALAGNAIDDRTADRRRTAAGRQR